MLKMNYKPEISGLRGIAVILVLLFHAFPEIVRHGYIGVDIFFVISGYLITKIVNEDISKNKFDLISFYQKRIKRLFPALIITLFTVLLFGWFFFFQTEFTSLNKYVFASSFFHTNLLALSEGGYFDNLKINKPLLNLWSLGVEVQFYLMYPVILFILNKYNLKNKFIFISLFVLSLTFSLLYSNFAFYSIGGRIWEFILGALVANSCYEMKVFKPNHRKVISITLIILILLSSISPLWKVSYPGIPVIVATFGTAYILLESGGQSPNILRGKILLFFGSVSYSLYLLHWPIFSIYNTIQSQNKYYYSNFLLISLSITAAFLVFRYIENPLRRSKSNFVTFILIVTLTTIGSFGYISYYYKNGWPKRGITQGLSDEVQYFGGMGMPTLSDGSCDLEKYLKKTPINNIICITNSQNPETVFMGDSMAASLYNAVYQGKFSYPNLMVISKPGCSLFSSYQGCDSYLDSVAEFLTSNKIKHIVIIHALPTNLPATHIFEWESNFNNFVKKISLEKIRVTYISSIPVYDFIPQDCLPRSPFLPASKCKINKMELDSISKNYRQIFKQLKNSHSEITFIDGFDIFCNSESCTPKQNNIFFTVDFAHLSVYGSIKVLGNIKQ